MPGSRAPNKAQQAWNNAYTQGMDKTGLRRTQQIARQRQQAPYERDQPHCISCLGPRDRRSYPVCDICTRKRLAGLR